MEQLGAAATSVNEDSRGHAICRKEFYCILLQFSVHKQGNFFILSSLTPQWDTVEQCVHHITNAQKTQYFR